MQVQNKKIYIINSLTFWNDMIVMFHVRLMISWISMTIHLYLTCY